MTITPHFFASAALATAFTNNVFVAFLLGFLLHFVLDSLPHVDPGTFHNIRIPGFAKEINLAHVHSEDQPWPAWIYIFVIAEFIVVITFMTLMFRNRANFAIMMAGGIGGIFVDGMDNALFRFIFRWPVFRQIHWLHHRFHYELPREKWYWGLPAVIIITGASLWYLLKF
jgi:hypothetical protein